MKKDYRAQINAIRGEYLNGKLTYEEAKKLVEALLVEMNIKGEAIAKEFGQKYKKLTFGYVFR